MAAIITAMSIIISPAYITFSNFSTESVISIYTSQLHIPTMPVRQTASRQRSQR
jgi:hypothetical protein